MWRYEQLQKLILQPNKQSSHSSPMSPAIFKRPRGFSKFSRHKEGDLSQQLNEVALLASSLSEEALLSPSNESDVATIYGTAGDEATIVQAAVEENEAEEISDDEVAGPLLMEEEPTQHVTCTDLVNRVILCFCRSANGCETEPLLPVHNQPHVQSRNDVVFQFLRTYLLTRALRNYLVGNQIALFVVVIVGFLILIVSFATGSLSGLIGVIERILCYNSESSYCHSR